jgi:ankyrin repeat protein
LDEENGDVNSNDDLGRTLLSLATEAGRIEVMELLLERGADADMPDNKRKTALSWAAQCGQTEAIKLLMKHDIRLDSKDAYGRTPLLWAFKEGHIESLRALLGRQGIGADIPDEDGQEAPYGAAQCGQTEAIKLLIKHGIQLNPKDAYGYTPLLWAIRGGHIESIRVLLGQKSVDADSSDRRGRRLLSWAADSLQSTEAIKLLLEHGNVDINAMDILGRTALSYAATEGPVEAVKLLLQKDGIQANLKDIYNETPLSYAIKWGNAQVLKLLLEQETIDFKSKLATINRGLFWACSHERRDAVIFEILLSQGGIDVNFNFGDGTTILSFVAKHGFNRAALSIILSKENVNVNPHGKDGRTPLSYLPKGATRKRWICY